MDPRPEEVLGSTEPAAGSRCELNCPTGGLERLYRSIAKGTNKAPSPVRGGLGWSRHGPAWSRC